MDFVRSYFSTTAKPVKKWGKKCSTGQRFICTEVTSYKIHILTISEWNHQFWFTVPLLLKNCKVDRQDRISLPDFSHKAIKAVKSVFKLCCPLINDKRCTNLCELVGGNFISKLIWRKGRKAGTYRSLQMQIIGLY